MKSLFCKSVLLLLLCLTANTFGQSKKLYQKTFTTQDGLEVDNINSLCYDNDGFLWLGGSNLGSRTIIISDKKLALQRFNGHTFHSIFLPELETPIKSVEHIYKRNDGQFYLVTKLDKGYKLFLFNPYTSQFKAVDFDSPVDGLSDIFTYNNEDYVLTQKGATIALQKLKADLLPTEIFKFEFTEKKFQIENSSKIIPFKDFVLLTDDNFPVKVLD